MSKKENQIVFRQDRKVIDTDLMSERKLMEMNVVAYNGHLRHSISGMSLETLIRHMHPLDRSRLEQRFW